MTILTVILPGLAKGHFRLELSSIVNTNLEKLFWKRSPLCGGYPLLILTLMRLKSVIWCLGMDGSTKTDQFSEKFQREGGSFSKNSYVLVESSVPKGSEWNLICRFVLEESAQGRPPLKVKLRWPHPHSTDSNPSRAKKLRMGEESTQKCAEFLQSLSLYSILPLERGRRRHLWWRRYPL